MTQPLAGKRAFVTGGSRGIGAAIVKRLAIDGADVVFTFVSKPAQADETAKAAAVAGRKVVPIQVDAGDADAVIAGVKQAADVLGGIDILVNSAGVALMGPVDTFSLADFDRTIAVNVRAVFVAIQAALSHMGTGGRIVNIGSCNAERIPFVGGSAYAMSKAALVGLVKGIAHDLGPRGITINNVEPGPTNTDMNPGSGPGAEGLHKFMALSRHAQPEEIAAMVAYLVGPEAGFVTGASLDIDGGFTA